MDWGMANRISKLIRPETNRAVWLAMDHGYFLGPVSRLEKPGETVRPLLPYADAIMLTRGVLRNCIDAKNSPPIILRVSGGNSIIGEDLSKETITTSIKDAIRLNVSAVAFSIYLGAKYEHQTLVGLANLINEAQSYGIPVLAVTAVGRELSKRDARFLSTSCRIAAELGAQMIKTYYCENFGKVVESSPVPLVIAGGPKLRTELDVLQLAYDAVQQGAVGVDMGRNIWQSNNSVAMIQAISLIVHKQASVKQAEELFNSLKDK
jgi:putative autoinducer-2 (AI-2) aldolase